MLKKLLVVSVIFLATTLTFIYKTNSDLRMSGAPPYGEPEVNAPENNVLPWLGNWQRPDGPAKVALQVGHWKSDQHPEELNKLRGNAGAQGGGKTEWEVNKVVADLVKDYLEEYQIDVEVLPATVPPEYWADIFLAIHADGNKDTSKSGYKIAAPWRDYTRNADTLVSLLEQEYGAATGLGQDPNVTRNMRGYYAFAWWRYEHSIHPMTTAAIIETGFLTNHSDRSMLINSPEIPANAIARGIVEYLKLQSLL